MGNLGLTKDLIQERDAYVRRVIASEPWLKNTEVLAKVRERFGVGMDPGRISKLKKNLRPRRPAPISEGTVPVAAETEPVAEGISGEPEMVVSHETISPVVREKELMKRIRALSIPLAEALSDTDVAKVTLSRNTLTGDVEVDVTFAVVYQERFQI